jgi:hypothetical protein
MGRKWALINEMHGAVHLVSIFERRHIWEVRMADFLEEDFSFEFES